MLNLAAKDIAASRTLIHAKVTSVLKAFRKQLLIFLLVRGSSGASA